VAVAIETLSGKKELDVSVNGDDKIIAITEDGLISLYSKKYLIEYYTVKKDRTIYESTISTNKSVKRIGWLTLLVAALAAVVSILQYNKPDTDYKPALQAISNEVKALKEKVVIEPAKPALPTPVEKKADKK
ncbi:MAG: hypothetical protein KGO82_09095, partial [Bacteroidota bacterium]|nr:hypothetical protein [Bacteroidota bacterium]